MMKSSIKNTIRIMAISFCLICIGSIAAFAATEEQEPNNTPRTAQDVTLGTEYVGTVTDAETDDEDYYKINVAENTFYKVTVYDMKDLGDHSWETMMVSLCKDSNTNDNRTITDAGYTTTEKIFRAAYSGSYYLKFWNSDNTQYSFKVEKYNPKGQKVKDSNGNAYKITSNSTLEFSKIASKKKSTFGFNTMQRFSTIGGYDVLDYYDVDFEVTSIGKEAFKGSGITSIYIPDSIKTIGAGAFQNCKRLGSEKWTMGLVIEGKQVTIGSKAFYGCKKLGTIRVLKRASIKSVKKGAFKGTKKGIRIEVPNVKKYKKIFKNAGFKSPKYSKAYM